MKKKVQKVKNVNYPRKLLITFALVIAILVLIFIAFYAISLFSEKYYGGLEGELKNIGVFDEECGSPPCGVQIKFLTDITLEGVFKPGQIHEELIFLGDHFMNLGSCKEEDGSELIFDYVIVDGPSTKDNFILTLDKTDNSIDADLTNAETGEYKLKIFVDCQPTALASGPRLTTASQVESNEFVMRVFYCSDSDGGQADVENKGTANNDTDTGTDSCNSNGELTEYYCNGNNILSITGSCSSGFKCENGACVDAGGDGEDDGGDNGGDDGGGDIPTCTDTCRSLGLVCGTHNICGSNKNCGTCSIGACVDGECVVDSGKNPVINSRTPNEEEVSAEPNETIRFTVSGEDYSKIEWLRDGVIVSTNNEFYEFQEGEEGEYEVKVVLSAGNKKDERTWKVIVKEKEKPSPFSWGLLIIILTIAGIGILLIILILVKSMLNKGSSLVPKTTISQTAIKTPIQPNPEVKPVTKPSNLGNLADKNLKPK